MKIQWQLIRVTIEIQDINDNAPIFRLNEIKFEISEIALAGATFNLETAVDTDVGLNGLQKYILKPSDNFIIKTHSLPDGSKSVEMVLQKPLDREKQDHIFFTVNSSRWWRGANVRHNADTHYSFRC